MLTMQLPIEILERILSHVDEPSTLLACIKSNSSLRNLAYKPKEKLLYHLYPKIWILIRFFNGKNLLKSAHLFQNIQRTSSVVRLRQYLGIRKRHLVYIYEDGKEIAISSKKEIPYFSSDFNFVEHYALLGCPKSLTRIHFQNPERKLLNQEWFWDMFLHFSETNYVRSEFARWAKFLFNVDLPSELFRRIWVKYDWPWVNALTESIIIQISGSDVIWLLEKIPGFELYLEKVIHFDPLLLSTGIDIQVWNWEAFSMYVSLKHFEAFPFLPWDNLNLTQNKNLPISSLLKNERMILDYVIDWKDPYDIAEHESNLIMIRPYMKKKNLKPFLKSCFEYKRYDFIREHIDCFLSDGPLYLGDIAQNITELC